MGSIIFFILALVLISPAVTCVFDAMCWFYSTSTCSGLVYNADRIGIIVVTTVLSVFAVLVAAA
jgi:hypothetical protein